MGTYGSGIYGYGYYGGAQIQNKFTPVSAYIEVYDKLLNFKNLYQSGVGYFLGCNFTLDDSGCRSFTLMFSDYVEIEKNDIIKIKIFDSSDYFFTGVIRMLPIKGSTKNEFNYSGFGLNDYLIRINTESLSYAGDTIRDIVIDLLDNVIILKSPIKKNLNKIDTLSTIITGITFKYISVSDAFDQLKKIANADGNDYLVGVDREGDFVFKARDTDVRVTLVVGKHGDYGIEKYEPEDSYEAKSKLYVLKKDGTFYDSYSSSENIDLYEIKLTAPDIDDADIDNWAEGQLKELELETRQASIDWQIEKSNPLILEADGSLRIISNIPPKDKTLEGSLFGDGYFGDELFSGEEYSGYDLDDILKIKEVTYQISDIMAFRRIRVGSLPVELDREIIEVNKNIEDLRVSLGR